jgi:hypothetical protein
MATLTKYNQKVSKEINSTGANWYQRSMMWIK